ncbi:MULTISPECIES: aminotransferase class V-fold PLP-dependent enzyme [unclassified Solwaraspora]|uniref:aminotransferase class V-fold PLP-dependent enzyme n=1 Tax=unclassified Solwaraspora TaxID=2627926 RepID=UPI00259B1562|nr:aminotransferase class V-fold PLP-dependent enzyme [Solwaraspora sp. WMMA2056]WJK40007.1 aminotransferase class V-fold PLP-dependent enzyme [Solwaraspora sp. WMMA2056]
MIGGSAPPVPLPGARMLFSLDPATAYLNHGAFGAVPVTVQRTQQRLRDEMEANPHRFLTQGLLDRLAHTRRHLAAFLGADPDNAALVDNVTVATAMVLRTLRLAAGDEVLLTNHGYGAVALSVDRECRLTGAARRVVDLPLAASAAEVVEAVRAALRPGRTRLLVVDQVTSATARLMPVAGLVAAARDAGVPVLVDAAHVPGMLPVEVDRIGADFWVGNLHKWAFAPRATALLVVRPSWRARLEPLGVSWEQDSGFPQRVEWQGTRDYTAWLAAPVGLYTLRSLGVDRVRQHNAALVGYGQRVVADALGVPEEQLPQPDADQPGAAALAMRLVPLPGAPVDGTAQATRLRQRIADELATEVLVSWWSGRAWLRICAQVYNQAAEYDRLAEGLPGVLRRAG